MAKKYCDICGKEFGLIEFKYPREDEEGNELLFCYKCDKKRIKNEQKKEKEEVIEEEKPIIKFKGRNGIIELHKNFVRLNRETGWGFVLQGLKGVKDIYFKNITAIQIKKPGFAVGYIQFSIKGSIESSRGVFDAVRDENTLTFVGENEFKKAKKIKKYIEDANMKKDKIYSGGAEEIERFYKLMKKGIITKKEFEQKKKNLLK